ncbi:hypothetical protein BH09MYX1_BH09MYX1_20430 [soil metagenome]
MSRPHSRALTFVIALAAPAITLVACGARTGLLAPDAEDASIDATSDRRDATADRDATPDVRDATAEDALPSIDSSKDGPKPPPLGCTDAGATQIYLITSQNELLSFYPPTLLFTKVGNIACPDAGAATPFSMGVDRSGFAFSVFNDGRLFRVSTATAACQTTPYVANQLGFQVFGMGYAGDQNSEKLYTAESDFNNPSKGLAAIDTQTFLLSSVGAFQPPLPRCELTGTGDDRLFAFCLKQGASGSIIAQIDRTNAKVVAADNLVLGNQSNAFAFAFWGGDFYIFTSPGGASSVTKYDPLAKTETIVATHPSTIVGAGVSTCAPQ